MLDFEHFSVEPCRSRRGIFNHAWFRPEASLRSRLQNESELLLVSAPFAFLSSKAF
jgi:hypothetical protein